MAAGNISKKTNVNILAKNVRQNMWLIYAGQLQQNSILN